MRLKPWAKAGVAGVLLAALGCQEWGRPLSPGDKVRRADAAGAVTESGKAVAPESAPTKASVLAGWPWEGLPSWCRVTSVETRDVSSDTMLGQRAMEGLLDDQFGAMRVVSGEEEGLALQWEYVFYRRQSDGDSLYLGAKAFNFFANSNSAGSSALSTAL